VVTLHAPFFALTSGSESVKGGVRQSTQSGYTERVTRALVRLISTWAPLNSWSLNMAGSSVPWSRVETKSFWDEFLGVTSSAEANVESPRNNAIVKFFILITPYKFRFLQV